MQDLNRGSSTLEDICMSTGGAKYSTSRKADRLLDILAITFDWVRYKSGVDASGDMFKAQKDNKSMSDDAGGRVPLDPKKLLKDLRGSSVGITEWYCCWRRLRQRCFKYWTFAPAMFD